MTKDIKYNELLHKAGRTVDRISIFINTLAQSGLIPKSQLATTQAYLKEQLLTTDTLEIWQEYKIEIKRVAEAINATDLSTEVILNIIEEELNNSKDSQCTK